MACRMASLSSAGDATVYLAILVSRNGSSLPALYHILPAHEAPTGVHRTPLRRGSGDEGLQRLVEARFGERAEESLGDDAVTVNQHRHRQSGEQVGSGQTLWRGSTWIGDAVLSQKLQAVLLVGLPGQPQEDGAARPVSIRAPGIHEDRRLLVAGIAPGGPKIEDDRTSLEGGEALRLAGGAVPERQREVGSRLADQHRRRMGRRAGRGDSAVQPGDQ